MDGSIELARNQRVRERERTELMGARADDNDDEGKKEVNLGIGARDHGAVRRD